MYFVISIIYNIYRWFFKNLKLIGGIMVGDRSELRAQLRRELKLKNKSKQKKKRRIKTLVLIFLLLLSYPLISSLKNIKSYKIFKNKNINSDLYNFMKDESSRTKVYNQAIKLNNGSSANTCVYFIAEALRLNGENIDNSICNTSQLLSAMENDGWNKQNDYKKLKPGDICFTTDEKLRKDGIPTHTYIFMGWLYKGRYDYAYICDNQAKDYKGKIYHLRNIIKTENVNGNQKEPFSFFLYR